MRDQPQPTAVALLSGGLDSTLAAKLVLDQGVRVIGVNFAGAYCPRPLQGKSNAEKAAAQLGIELVTLPIDQEFIEMVKSPKHGRGRNMNPCIDCHILMVRKAWEYGQTRGAQFIITGEVLGQRPMSQNRQALELVARESGTKGRLVRPLSAKLLDETLPERQGLLDRHRLSDIQGRMRKRQIVLAVFYRIKDYPTPAGGCLLTEPVFSSRLLDAFAHGEDSVPIVELLGLGRHFRLRSGARVVIGRDQKENAALAQRASAGALVIDATHIPGPLCLLIPVVPNPTAELGHVPVSDEDVGAAARLCAAFSDRRRQKQVRVQVNGQDLEVNPATQDEIAAWRID
ncbi:MAG: 7-cyano-7-deazaguanine synthase [candidate division WOR-3 bacterium]